MVGESPLKTEASRQHPNLPPLCPQISVFALARPFPDAPAAPLRPCLFAVVPSFAGLPQFHGGPGAFCLVETHVDPNSYVYLVCIFVFNRKAAKTLPSRCRFLQLSAPSKHHTCQSAVSDHSLPTKPRTRPLMHCGAIAAAVLHAARPFSGAWKLRPAMKCADYLRETGVE